MEYLDAALLSISTVDIARRRRRQFGQGQLQALHPIAGAPAGLGPESCAQQPRVVVCFCGAQPLEAAADDIYLLVVLPGPYPRLATLCALR